MAERKRGRPHVEFDQRTFIDLVGLGCSEDEICFFFRDETGKPANVNTLSRWCERTFGMNYREFSKQNKLLSLKIKLRRNQLKLSEKSASMAIWLGKQYLGQRDRIEVETAITDDTRAEIGEMLNELDKGDGNKDS